MYIKRFQLVWVWLHSMDSKSQALCIEGDITSTFEIKKSLQLHGPPPWPWALLDHCSWQPFSISHSAFWDKVMYVGLTWAPFFLFLFFDTYIWMVYDKACYLERTPNELEMGYVGETRLDYEITFNIWILDNCLALVKEPCKSIVLVDLHIFRWWKTSFQKCMRIV